MKMIKVRRIPKKPYATCAACGIRSKWGKPEILAPNQIILLRAERTELWLCDKHLEQLKRDVSAIEVENGDR